MGFVPHRLAAPALGLQPSKARWKVLSAGTA
jgi:hypothetical protein